METMTGYCNAYGMERAMAEGRYRVTENRTGMRGHQRAGAPRGGVVGHGPADEIRRQDIRASGVSVWLRVGHQLLQPDAGGHDGGDRGDTPAHAPYPRAVQDVCAQRHGGLGHRAAAEALRFGIEVRAGAGTGTATGGLCRAAHSNAVGDALTRAFAKAQGGDKRADAGELELRSKTERLREGEGRKRKRPGADETAWGG